MLMQWIQFFKIRKFLKQARDPAKQPREAICILNPIFAREDFTTNYKIWKSTWQTLGQIINGLDAKSLADKCFAVARDWENLELLYELGYDLVEQDLFYASIPLFEKGLKLAPGNEHFLLELVNSFEEIERFDLAKDKLLSVPELLKTSFFPRYLMTFYSILLLDNQSAKEWFNGLDKLCDCDDDTQKEIYCGMHEKIKRMLQRFDELSAITPLDNRDTRGWNAVLNANVLLNLSEHDASMNGRYGYFQESPEFMFECIAQLKTLLLNIKCIPERILAFPDRDSQILALAAAHTLNCPIEEYSETTKTLPGLIICYNIKSSSVSKEIRMQAQEAYENQILWCHTFDWTQGSISPDIISYFSQYSSPSWEKRVVIKNVANGEIIGNKPEFTDLPALEGSCENIYKQIQGSVGENPKEEISPILECLAQQLFCLDEKGLSVFDQKRTRYMQILSSPVSSSRFF